MSNAWDNGRVIHTGDVDAAGNIRCEKCRRFLCHCAVDHQRHIDKVREILGHWHNSTCKTSAFVRDDGPCDCGAEDKARRIVEYFERVVSA